MGHKLGYQQWGDRGWRIFLGLSGIVATLMTSLPVQAAPDAQVLPSVPNRRKPGASRPSTEIVEAPMRRKPGSNRDLGNSACPVDPQSMTALLPPSLTTVTAAHRPTLLVALPAMAQTVPLELVVRNSQDELVYERLWWGNPQAGILPLTLPSQVASQPGDYHWYVSVICQPGDRAKDWVVEGILQKVEPKTPVQVTASLEQFQFYQSQKLSQDALSLLSQLRQDHPQDATVQALWQQTLKDLALDSAIAGLASINP